MSRPRWIYAAKSKDGGLLPAGTRLTLALLWSYADLGALEAFVFPSTATLAEVTGAHIRTLRKRLSELTEAGHIRRTRGRTPRGEADGWDLRTPAEAIEGVAISPPERPKSPVAKPPPPAQMATPPPGHMATPGGSVGHSEGPKPPPIRHREGAIKGEGGKAQGRPVTAPDIWAALVPVLHDLQPGGRGFDMGLTPAPGLLELLADGWTLERIEARLREIAAAVKSGVIERRWWRWQMFELKHWRILSDQVALAKEPAKVPRAPKPWTPEPVVGLGEAPPPPPSTGLEFLDGKKAHEC